MSKQTLRFVVTFTMLWLAGMRYGYAQDSFWARDVWKDPERPFLFYGEEREHTSRHRSLAASGSVKSIPEVAGDVELETLQTLPQLQREVRRRLERAVMHPTPEAVRAYLQANAFLLEKSARFSDAWRDALLERPEYDWTSTHPTVNAASTTLSRERAERVRQELGVLTRDWGLVFVGDDSRLTALMQPLVARFAALYGFEIEYVAVTPMVSLPQARVAPELAARLTERGLKQFPALVLVSRQDRRPAQARLVATGVVDVLELGRRVVRLVHREQEKQRFTVMLKTEMDGQVR